MVRQGLPKRWHLRGSLRSEKEAAVQFVTEGTASSEALWQVPAPGTKGPVCEAQEARGRREEMEPAPDSHGPQATEPLGFKF